MRNHQMLLAVQKCKVIISCRVAVYCEVHGDTPSTDIHVRYSIMQRCWRADPAERPTFSELASILGRFLQLVVDYTQSSP